jgi:20S proteasome alpha/beta subunit
MNILTYLNYVGITHKGLEDITKCKDKILFQTSGSLADITSAIASFFGFYYFM